ncbi:2-polyprenyl-6-methoxyphenol hydroxylase-like oxidoreductase [Mycolicibacterium sp. 050158]|uniref:NAD(P)/FAD-dependent oxidoreductase n=1 Tax=Mycolicibacterium sp. 050158 TaxID=3090602 RepID=UPI00299EB988|nr:2-polyprenyl-6-methoxyphenol hydroxylase-like oxidoreductase [Mycolicibacterium sp. 050158]MDX1892415.1 2-polyprenyl-6-methoxyphenol hydroxylase-like oxidoreductase [Mycolicibacterium sp. 050158]
MGGLFAARAFCEFYDRVTVVERDVLMADARARRGVPQGRQPHVLLARCGEIAEELFPGILDELVAEGAHRWDDGDLTRFDAVFGGHRIVRTGVIPDPRSLVNYYASRPLIEGHVRRRVRKLTNVGVLDGHQIVELRPRDGRIGKVAVRRLDDGAQATLDAQLVVDATGRGSRTPALLAALGYRRPTEEELAVRVAYASMPIRIPEGRVHEHAIFRLFQPGLPRGFVMFRCERDEWMVGVGTLGAIEPPATPGELFDFAEGLAPPHALAAARAAEPLADVGIHRFPASRWRRYDKLDRMPRGLIVLGDAVCSFNPIYGQGMTVAAIEATILRDCLRRGDDGLARRFHRAAAKKIRIAWQTAVGSDLALPEVAGPRPLSMRVTNSLVDRVLTAAESDPFVAQEFMRVTGMLQPPSRMMLPSFVFHVARAGRRSAVRPAPQSVGTGSVTG